MPPCLSLVHLRLVLTRVLRRTAARVRPLVSLAKGGGIFERNGVWYVMFGQGCCFCPFGGSSLVYTAAHPLGPYTYSSTANALVVAPTLPPIVRSVRGTGTGGAEGHTSRQTSTALAAAASMFPVPGRRDGRAPSADTATSAAPAPPCPHTTSAGHPQGVPAKHGQCYAVPAQQFGVSALRRTPTSPLAYVYTGMRFGSGTTKRTDGQYWAPLEFDDATGHVLNMTWQSTFSLP